MNRILEKQLQYDMDRLRADFRLMSELVHLALTDAVEALKDRDRKKAYEVILRDSKIDNLESTIDKHCLEFLVKHIPAAMNLRFVYSAAKISSEVERVGDYAETIARQAIELSYSTGHTAVALLVEMSNIAFRMFFQATQAFLDSNIKLAQETSSLDRQVDEFEERIYKTLTTENIANSAHAKQVYSLLNIANRIERVADQSCNICEEVVYMLTGEMVKHHHEKEVSILFICEGNSCRSQMAEAIGNKVAKGEKFRFFSAGGKPKKDIDPGAARYLASKGYELKGQKPKGLDSVPSLDSFDVLVTLCDESCVTLPRIPFKTVALNWNIEDPSALPHNKKNAAYEKTFEMLETRIKDLVNAFSH